jgi:hypothetical protein
MIRIASGPIVGRAGVVEALQNAVRLEHATVPPYLTALYTLKPGGAGVRVAAGILRGIVEEEMLHMALACNILNAIGGTPRIAEPGFIPDYPGPLPMGIEEGSGSV